MDSGLAQAGAGRRLHWRGGDRDAAGSRCRPRRDGAGFEPEHGGELDRAHYRSEVVLLPDLTCVRLSWRAFLRVAVCGEPDREIVRGGPAALDLRCRARSADERAGWDCDTLCCYRRWAADHVVPRP